MIHPSMALQPTGKKGSLREGEGRDGALSLPKAGLFQELRPTLLLPLPICARILYSTGSEDRAWQTQMKSWMLGVHAM